MPISLVEVNQERCAAVADLLRRVAIPSAEEDAPLIGVKAEALPDVYLAIVAICHQTSPKGGQRLEGFTEAGQWLFGWDYLRARWAERIVQDPDRNTPRTWAQIGEKELEWLLQDANGRSTLSDAVGRAELLRDLGEGMNRHGAGSAEALYRASQGMLESEEPLGLYGRLARFRAYRDPVRKKSCFFLELMRGQCGWNYMDEQNLGAPVDYHEVRGHLRIGTVVIKDSDCERRIRAGTLLSGEEDVAIRLAVYGAIQEISVQLGNASPSTLHYLFWNVFRRCCGRDNTHCMSCGNQCGLPERYSRSFAATRPNQCFFAPACKSVSIADKLCEHTCTTDYY
jgi:hypothetical protein